MPFNPDLSPMDSLYELRGNLDRWARLDVLDDGTPSATWPDRWQIRWEISPGVFRTVAWFNERGEFRCLPALENTVAWALYIKDHTADPAHHTTNVWQILDDRDLRNVLIGIDSSGKFVGPNAPEYFGTWTTIPLDPAFATSSAGYRVPEIRRAPGGIFELRGRMASVGAWVANTSVIATLAPAFWPAFPAQLLVRASSTMANLIVNTDGTIVSAQAVAGGSNASVEGLRYSI